MDGLFVANLGMYSDLPPTRTYTLVSPSGLETVTVTVSWLGILPIPKRYQALITIDLFIKLFCTKGAGGVGSLSGPSGAAATAMRGLDSGVTSKEFRKPGLELAKKIFGEDDSVSSHPTRGGVSTSATPRFASDVPMPTLSDTLQYDKNVGIGYLNESDTAVLAMPSFVPGDADRDQVTQGHIQRLNMDMLASLKRLDSLNAHNLIIDFTGNGGGVACVGSVLLRYLFPNADFPHFDIRLTSKYSYLLENKIKVKKAGDFVKLTLAAGIPSQNSSSTKEDLPASLIANARSFVRGGVSDRYTSRFIADCNQFIHLAPLNEAKPLQPGWAPVNIAIVSNGECGSTCAIVTRV
ncbi:hypothetical protein HDU96_007085 [Phlyctochytrium bullatum]|nr:hypothetical protein HDU96_007085 [Phlyctochytrium bullatum]